MNITKVEALGRTKRMLLFEWNLGQEPLSTTKLKTAPPDGLGKNEAQIRALETPIEGRDFADVNARVGGHDLADAETVGELRDVIWDGIPEEKKA